MLAIITDFNILLSAKETKIPSRISIYCTLRRDRLILCSIPAVEKSA